MKTRIFLILFFSLLQPVFSHDAFLTLPALIQHSNPYLILGDLFPQEPPEISVLDKSRVLLKMPPPGQEMVLKSEDIQHFLQLYKIDVPVILRDVKIVSLQTPLPLSTPHMSLESLLHQHLQQVYGPGPWSMELQNDTPQGYLFNDAIIEQSALKDGVLTCVLVFPALNRVLPLQAKVGQLVKTPLLNRVVMPGEIITPEDIQWKNSPVENLSAADALKAEDMVHFTPLQPLQPGVPIKKSLLKKPKVVLRGNLVSLVLQTPYMVLTQRKAQAMEDGAMGQPIKVCNLDTKRTVVGIVKNSTTVEVPYESH